MTDTPSRSSAPRWFAQAIEYVPLGAFLVTWLYSKDLILATKVVMGASALAVVVSFIVQRKIPWMPLITAVLVGVFGGLTVYLNDDSFIKMKPSVINTLFATVLLGSMAFGKLPLRYVMGSSIPMPKQAWKTLTIRAAIFFLALAALNEAVWRTQPEEIWVYFRFPGLMGLTFLFFASQVPFMMRNMKQSEAGQDA